MIIEENSMLYWYPKLKGTETRTPRTEMIELNNKERLIEVCDGNFEVLDWDKIITSASKMGFPLFMRTDEFSGKHNWKNTCYVEKESDLKQNIRNLFEDSFCADIMGLPLRALVFRTYIPMQNLFNAFYGEMPVNPEIRFFVKDGEVVCWHWYWIDDAIEQGTPKNLLPSDWKQIIQKEKDTLLASEIEALNNQARRVAKNFEGYWSIDFCKSKRGEWYLIDMASGYQSWHPEDCPTFKKEGMKPR
jgi:hypothetical protein